MASLSLPCCTKPLLKPSSNGTGAAAAMAVDNKGFIWIICGGTGEVWRGRLNRMGWADQKTSFTE